MDILQLAILLFTQTKQLGIDDQVTFPDGGFLTSTNLKGHQQPCNLIHPLRNITRNLCKCIDILKFEILQARLSQLKGIFFMFVNAVCMIFRYCCKDYIWINVISIDTYCHQLFNTGLSICSLLFAFYFQARTQRF